MIVAICTIQLYLAGNGSLKGKRGRLKPLLVRPDAGYLHGLMEKTIRWIETGPYDVQLVDYQIELV
jgi:hypothetical protein